MNPDQLCPGCLHTYTVTGGDFDPNWTLHPGATFNEIIEYSNETAHEVAKQIGVDAWPALAGVLAGTQLPSVELTVAFARWAGVEPRFLWQLRTNYELDLAMGKKDVSGD